MLNTGDDDFVAAPVTSQARVSDFDLALEDWQGAGLNVASYVRVHKLAVLAKAEVVRRIGSLVERDVESMQALLCRGFCRDGSTE